MGASHFSDRLEGEWEGGVRGPTAGEVGGQLAQILHGIQPIGFIQVLQQLSDHQPLIEKPAARGQQQFVCRALVDVRQP